MRRYRSGSCRADSAVEPTRSQNMMVMRRSSPAEGGSVASRSPASGLVASAASTSLASRWASSTSPRLTASTARSRSSSTAAVLFGSTGQDTRLVVVLMRASPAPTRRRRVAYGLHGGGAPRKAGTAGAEVVVADERRREGPAGDRSWTAAFDANLRAL